MLSFVQSSKPTVQRCQGTPVPSPCCALVSQAGKPFLRFAGQELLRRSEVLQVTLGGEFCSLENLVRTN